MHPTTEPPSEAKLTELKGKVDSATVIVGDFNTLLLVWIEQVGIWATRNGGLD